MLNERCLYEVYESTSQKVTLFLDNLKVFPIIQPSLCDIYHEVLVEFRVLNPYPAEFFSRRCQPSDKAASHRP